MTRGLGLIIPFIGVALGVLHSANVLAGSAAYGPREVIALGTGWRFHFGDAGPDATRERFDDSAWSSVSVPHTWNRVGYYLPDPVSHIHRRETVNREQGIGWYRLTFDAPASASGRRAWLQLDAASRAAAVWLNGEQLGTHSGAFSRFRFDATRALRPGASNLLVVKTDNTPPQPGAATQNDLPYSGDFFVHGGLYRPVSLVLTDSLHLDMLDSGGPGAYATTKRATATLAEVGVQSRVRNDGDAREVVTVAVELLDVRGSIVARDSRRVALDAGAESSVMQTLVLNRPRLWQGTTDPYLHTLRVTVRDTRGRVRDRLDQPFGVRTFAFEAQRGLLLNGVPLRLRGVGYHQDREGKGWAISAEDTAEDLAIIREMGANSIRLTHYQHGQPVHDLADRYGLVLWDEIPLVTAWTLREQQQPDAALVENARQQLRELIRQNFNHASVVVWGIANEVDFGRGRPDFLGKPPSAGIPDPLPLLRQLHELAKREDPSRATAIANCCELRSAPGEGVPVVSDVTDVFGVNRYFGWYYGEARELGPHLDRLHAQHPNRPLSVSEYGAGGATTMHTDDARGARPDSRGRLQPEESMSLLHEENWRQLVTRPYLWATWLWNSFDFATTVRREGDADDINTKGLVTYDRKIRKDAFYFYRANWTTTPTVRVNSSRYTDRALAVTDVRVYSNAPETELTVNGQSLGARKDCELRTCVWAGVRLSPGDNRVTATGRFAGTSVDHTATWRVDDRVAVAVRIDAGALAGAQASSGRFGSDTYFDGGAPGSTDTPGNWGRAPVMAKIAGTADRDLAATFREGTFRYHVPIADGSHIVTLTFVDPAGTAGARVFDVIANGQRVIEALDVAAAAGAPLTAITRQFTTTVTGGALDLEFRPQKGQAIVSAIEIAP